MSARISFAHSVLKRVCLSLACAAAVTSVSNGAPAFYVNDGIVNATNLDVPVIDAFNFINNGYFSVFTTKPYRTYDTRNYTNNGTMLGSPGFDFRNTPASGTSSVKWARNFVNSSGSAISCSGFGNFFTIGGVGTLFGNLANLTGSSQFIVGATNININSSTVSMDASSLMRLRGRNIDLRRGTLEMQNTFTFLFGTGVGLISAAGLDGYWGVGSSNRTGFLFPNFDLATPPLITPAHPVTNRNYTINLFNQIVLFTNYTVYANEFFTDISNRFVQVAFVGNTNSAFQTSVFFNPLSDIEVQWQWTNSSLANGAIITNFLGLTDDFGEITNLGVAANGFVGSRLTYKPVNYQFFSGVDFSFGGIIPSALPGLPPNTFDNLPATNQYAAYQAIFSAATQFPSDTTYGDVTNLSGRIEINADKTLDLTASHIAALNTLLLYSTNHYQGNKGAVVTAPYYDIALRTTNGSLTISNLVPQYLQTPQGICNLWSARWTNNASGNITNHYHVLVVDGQFAPVATPQVQTLTLRSTKDLVLSDVMNVTRSMLLTATNITLTTNGTGASSTVGGLNFLSSRILWSSDTPRCQNLTNWGFINAQNAVFFGGSRSSPFYNRTFSEPYLSFVNHGGVTNYSSLIWARHFENTGAFVGTGGSITLKSATDASMTNGAFIAPTGDIVIQAENLSVTNHPLLAGFAFKLYITNSITDCGGTNNGNIFTAGNGFSLFVKPPTGDLRSTIVTNTAYGISETLNYWAGEDRGADTAGFLDNVAIGHLILDGGTNGLLHFIGTGDQNAMYVDLLELKGTAANIIFDGTGFDLTGVTFDDNMTIYYSDVTINGQSQAEHLNGANHGHLVWVPSFAGNFTTVTLSWTNSSGTVYYYTMNSALRNSCNIDSDNDGLVNCVDPTPLGDPPDAVLTQSFSKELVELSVGITNKPSPAAVISWNAPHNSTNFVYARSSYTDPNWITVTNFVYRGPSGRLTIKDPIQGNTHRFYRVRVDPPAKK